MKEYNEHMAFLIFVIEKEFNVGPITEHFPLLKLFNLVDKNNVKRYEKMNKKHSHQGGTFR